MIKTVNRIVALGLSSPTSCFANRMAMAGIKTFFIGLKEEGVQFNRSLKAFQKEDAFLDLSLFRTDEGIAAVKLFVQKVQAEAIFSADDWILTQLGKSRAEFEPDCAVLAPDPFMLEQMWDKIHQTSLAASSGFDVLPSYALKTEADMASIPESAFPIVIRPSYINSAQPNFKARVLKNREDLVRLFNSTHWTHPPMVQSFRLAPNYILHGVRALSGEILALRLFKAYRKYRGFCSSMEPIPLPARLEASARQFVEQANIIGPFHFDLLACEAEGKSYFLEVNIRLGGSTGKVVKLGFDEPSLMLAAFNAMPATPLPSLRAYSKFTSLGLNLTQAWNDLRNHRDPLAYPQLPRFHSILAALSEIILVHKA
jgi:biotin carboxylase